MNQLVSQTKMKKRKSAQPPDRTGLAMHSAASCDWGTPMLLRRFAQHVLGPAATRGRSIDLDYASSAYWQSWWPDNDAPRVYLDGSPGKDVLVAADRDRACPERGSGFMNAPGLHGGEMVQKCWELFDQDHRDQKLGSGVWVGFSLEHFASFQGLGGRNPLTVGTDMTTIVPSRRARYLLHPEQLIAITRKKLLKREKHSKQWRAEQRRIVRVKTRGDDAPLPGAAPSHASYIVIFWSPVLGVRREQMARARQFLEEQRKDEKSLLSLFETIGSLDGGARR